MVPNRFLAAADVEQPAGPAARPPRRSRRPAVGPKRGAAAVVSVSRLAAKRWHIRLAPSDTGRVRELYLSPEDGGLLAVQRLDDRLEIRLHGGISEGGVCNLGDCLIRALCEGVRRIDLHLGQMETVPEAACTLLESFGRNVARERLSLRLDIDGPEPGAGLLRQAFTQGGTGTDPSGGAS